MGVVRSLATRLEPGTAAELARGQPAPHGLGLPSDSALAVPFGRNFPRPRLDHTVGVIVHVYYPDLAEEIREYLESIPGSADVYISTDTDKKRETIEQPFRLVQRAF